MTRDPDDPPIASLAKLHPYVVAVSTMSEQGRPARHTGRRRRSFRHRLWTTVGLLFGIPVSRRQRDVTVT